MSNLLNINAMTPQEYINNLQMTIRDFDDIAEASIRAVGIDFFKERYNKAFDKSLTIKGNNFKGIPFSVKSRDYLRDWRPGRKYDKLSISDKGNLFNPPNSQSFRRSMYFEGNGGDLRMSDNATWKGDEYGTKVIDTMMQNGIDVLEYENKDEYEKDLFLSNFIRIMNFDDEF